MRKGFRKFKKEEVLRAIANSGGIIEVVARKLGADRTTVRKYLKEASEYSEAMSDAREAFKDLAENKLMTAVNNNNLTAIIFTLKTIGRDRGYVEKGDVLLSVRPPVIQATKEDLALFQQAVKDNVLTVEINEDEK